MTNNDILKRLRYTFDFSDQEMINIFRLTNYDVSREEICDWLKKEDVESYKNITDRNLAIFLNGLIILKRGKKEDIPLPVPEKSLTNNMILRKIKIALNLKSEDIINLLASKDKIISKHELSAFFRNPNHAKYKSCNDQYLRNLLYAIQEKYKSKK